jgi:hypothetical protein
MALRDLHLRLSSLARLQARGLVCAASQFGATRIDWRRLAVSWLSQQLLYRRL